MRLFGITLAILWITLPPLMADQAATLFDDSTVREIRLYFDDANWYTKLYQAHSNV